MAKSKKKRKDCSKRARARAHDKGLAAFAAFNRRCKVKK